MTMTARTTACAWTTTARTPVCALTHLADFSPNAPPYYIDLSVSVQWVGQETPTTNASSVRMF